MNQLHVFLIGILFSLTGCFDKESKNKSEQPQILVTSTPGPTSLVPDATPPAVAAVPPGPQVIVTKGPPTDHVPATLTQQMAEKFPALIQLRINSSSQEGCDLVIQHGLALGLATCVRALQNPSTPLVVTEGDEVIGTVAKISPIQRNYYPFWMRPELSMELSEIHVKWNNTEPLESILATRSELEDVVPEQIRLGIPLLRLTDGKGNTRFWASYAIPASPNSREKCTEGVQGLRCLVNEYIVFFNGGGNIKAGDLLRFKTTKNEIRTVGFITATFIDEALLEAQKLPKQAYLLVTLPE